MVKRILLPLTLVILTVSLVTAKYELSLTLDDIVEQKQIHVQKAGKIIHKINKNTVNPRPILTKKKFKRDEVDEKLEWLETKFKGIAFKVFQDFYNNEDFIIDKIVLAEDFDVLYQRYLEEMHNWEEAHRKSQMLFAKSDNFQAEYAKQIEKQKMLFEGRKQEIVDEVKTKQAAPVKTNSKLTAYEIAKSEIETDIDESQSIIAFEYSKSDKKEKSGPIEPLSGERKDLAASNEAPQDLIKMPTTAGGPIGPGQRQAQTASKAPENIQPLVVQAPKPDYPKPQTQPSATLPVTSQPEDQALLASARSEELIMNSSVTLTAAEYSFGKGRVGKVSNIELRVGHTDNDRYEDLSSGIIQVDKAIASEVAMTRGLLIGNNYVDMNFDLVFTKNRENSLELPMITRESMERFLDKRQFDGDGGYILVELDSLTESVEIDSPYFEKVFLNKRFRVVPDDGDYNFVMFIGVEPGTTSVEFVRNGMEKYQKIVLVEYESIFYEPNIYLENKQQSFELFEKSLFGKGLNPLVVDGDLVEEFLTNKTSQKRGPNNYYFNKSVVPFGMKKYVRFAHMGAPLWISHWNEEKMTIPSENYIAQLLGMLNLDSIENLCLIQIEFPKRVESFNAIGRTGDNFLGGDQIFLSETGELEDYISLNSIKGFLLGDRNGLVNIQVQYEDGTEDLISTVCAPGNYFIEKL